MSRPLTDVLALKGNFERHLARGGVVCGHGGCRYVNAPMMAPPDPAIRIAAMASFAASSA
jgi:hypothetical protein